MAMLFRGVLSYLNIYLLNWVSVRAIADLRATAFNHLLNMPLSFFSKTSTGELMSRVGDISVLQNIVGVSLATLIKDPVTLLCYIFLLFSMQVAVTPPTKNRATPSTPT